MKGQEVIAGFVIAIFILLGFFILANQLNTNVFINSTLLDYKYVVKTGDTISWLDVLGNLTIGGGYGSGGISAYDNGDLFISGDVILNGDILQVNATLINGSIYPEYNGVFDIGNTTNYYRNIYIINLIVQQNITFTNLSGINTSYVCVDSIGQLYRNDSCLQFTTTSTTTIPTTSTTSTSSTTTTSTLTTSTSTSTSTSTTTTIQVTYNILVNATNDTYIDQYNVNTNYGTGTTLTIGRSDSGSGDKSGLLYFNLSTIPSNATITDSTLYLRTTVYSTQNNMSIFNLYRTWKEYQATWNIAYTSQNWGIAGADNTTTDRNATAEANITFTANNQWYNASIPLMTQIWVTNESQNNGLIIRHVTNNVVTQISSREGAQKPYLNITYNVP
jgi:hypothetical protein